MDRHWSTWKVQYILIACMYLGLYYESDSKYLKWSWFLCWLFKLFYSIHSLIKLSAERTIRSFHLTASSKKSFQFCPATGGLLAWLAHIFRKDSSFSFKPPGENSPFSMEWTWTTGGWGRIFFNMLWFDSFFSTHGVGNFKQAHCEFCGRKRRLTWVPLKCPVWPINWKEYHASYSPSFTWLHVYFQNNMRELQRLLTLFLKLCEFREIMCLFLHRFSTNCHITVFQFYKLYWI